MMKKVTFLLAAILLVATTTKTNAQADQQCALKANLFNGDYGSKKYDDAYVNLIYLLDNCASNYVSVYQKGDKIAKARFKNASNKDEAFKFVKRIYDQRLKWFPKKNPAKVHSDYATFLDANKLASKDEVFNLLQKAYEIDPTKMGVKNIYKYFQGITDRNKDTNPQKVFDTYDDVMESVQEKLDDYTKKLVPLLDSTKTLSKSEKRKKRIYSVNSKALGTVEGQFDRILSEIATCERLVPLYRRDLDANKGNGQWLKRAVSRMHNKGCQSDPLYAELAQAYAEASPSADAYSFLAGVLDKNGQSSEADAMRQKAFDLETDPFKKAKFKLKFAQNAKDKGRKGQARRLAMEALQFNPNLGKAYLFIAGMYASSANSCGKNEFAKRMVYVAAANKARRAAAIDPSISAKANRYARSYMKQAPSKKLIFTEGIAPGSSHRIGCWIGESARVPNN
ncbi:hypothetical protein OD91_1079 [Lutibacter sp. Hel_I_33_5]|uniref:hypothetical protein n=1 Tax=Lutibacter sp. Hel_I_33_5 TaxID=1566289 RepID=UPI0011AD169F|nr:hypothetical protein [Lutibacter sp. Hel_I_33_5]TVZ55812.1 hypothetical protein OD91_1079 [Lutibacter sp. Hel_I_33_5]